MQLILTFLAVVFFSAMAFHKPQAVLFMLAAGAAMMTGLYWYNIYVTHLGLTISLMFIGFSFFCIAMAYRCLFWREETGGEDTA